MLLVIFKRFLGKNRLQLSAADASDSLEQQVLQVQNGNMTDRNQIITDYQPFIAKITSRFCRRYIDPSRDDEFSIALDAFNEAIDKFSFEAGRSFLGFAETVIRRRLIDHVRKEQRFQKQVPYSSFDVQDEENQIVNPVENHEAIQQYEEDKTAEERRMEIMEFSRELSEFGISFSELADSSPKHSDSRHVLMQIGKTLAMDEQLMSQLRVKRMLPIKALMGQVEVSRKTLERNRKYVIAISLIYSGNYPYLGDYLYGNPISTERSG